MKNIFISYLLIISINSTAQGLLHEFNFDGTLNNTKNTISFTGTENYVDDRTGTPKGAQRISNKSIQAIIDDLPQDNAPRTVSIWIKFNELKEIHNLWGYGMNYNAQFFGLSQQADAVKGATVTDDVISNAAIEKNTWYQYCVTFDGKASSLYVNGKLIKSKKEAARKTKGAIFYIGEANSPQSIHADIDDLQIYDVALSAQEVLKAYNASKGTVTGTETQKIAATDPTNDKNQTRAVTPSAAKKIEIFSQGEKVTSNSSKDINLNDLPEGTYLLKISPAPKPTKKVSAK